MAYQLTHAELESLWELAGGPPQFADVAAAIAEAESGGCQYALAGPVDIRPQKVCTWTRTSGENSCGLWQINLLAHPQYRAPGIFDQLENAHAAVAISNEGQSFGAWTTYRNGAYRQHLTSGGTPQPQPGTTDTHGAIAPHAHYAFYRLQYELIRALPAALDRSSKIRAAMRRLAH